MAEGNIYNLSKGKKSIIIKSTLSNPHIYFTSLFIIPKKVNLRFEKIQRNFLYDQ